MRNSTKWLYMYATYLGEKQMHIKSYFTIYLGENMFVIEWFAGINCIILWSQIQFYRDASAER